jgi:hypothetical protein
MERYRKPSGWKGKKTNIFYVNERGQYGTRYMCAFCGKQTLGTYGILSERMHKEDCPWLLDQLQKKMG